MRALFQGRPFYFGLICFCTKNPNLPLITLITLIYADQKNFNGTIFICKFVSSVSSVVRFCFFCCKSRADFNQREIAAAAGSSEGISSSCGSGGRLAMSMCPRGRSEISRND